MSKQEKFTTSDEAWESGALGNDRKFAKVFAGDIQSQIDDAIAMQPISIRLPKSLIETYKLLGEAHGLGYQPLMRRVLHRFAEAELKRVLNEFVAEQHREAEGADEDGPQTATA